MTFCQEPMRHRLPEVTIDIQKNSYHAWCVHKQISFHMLCWWFSYQLTKNNWSVIAMSSRLSYSCINVTPVITEFYRIFLKITFDFVSNCWCVEWIYFRKLVIKKSTLSYVAWHKTDMETIWNDNWMNNDWMNGTSDCNLEKSPILLSNLIIKPEIHIMIHTELFLCPFLAWQHTET